MGAVDTMEVFFEKLNEGDRAGAVSLMDERVEMRIHVGDNARLQSATLIRQKISELAQGIPTIVTGDFNADQGSNPYDRMRGLDDYDTVRNFQDTYRNMHNDGGSVGTSHGFDGIAGDRRIDWILHDNDFSTLAAEIVRTSYDDLYPSDHFPITATVRPLNTPEPTGVAAVALVGSVLLSRRRRRHQPAAA